MITKLIRPVDPNHRVTSPYGFRMFQGKKQFHDGIDYVSDSSNRVLAITDGEILLDVDYYDASKRWTDRRHSAGNMIVIKHRIHGHLYYVRYLHLGKNFVNKGQKVRQGNYIGEYSDSGLSYGKHLHIDFFDNNWIKVDPTPILIRGLIENGIA